MTSTSISHGTKALNHLSNEISDNTSHDYQEAIMYFDIGRNNGASQSNLYKFPSGLLQINRHRRNDHYIDNLYPGDFASNDEHKSIDENDDSSICNIKCPVCRTINTFLTKDIRKNFTTYVKDNNVENKIICVICMDNWVDVYFPMCKHITVCKDCVCQM